MKQIIKKIKKLGLGLGIKKLIGYEAIFSCAFCRRERGAELYTDKSKNDKEFFFLPHSEDYWYADPLVYEKDGKEVIFLERVNRKTGLGCIACADISNGQWSVPVSIIEEPFHMSFPMCFNWKEDLYMIPETEMSECINLYRCIQFPYKWEKVGEYLQGMRLVDSIILNKNDKKVTFLASEYKPEDDFYTRFHCYEMNKNDGTITFCDLGRVSENYSLNFRTAGPMIEGKTRLLPLQRSTSGIYGFSVQFNCYNGIIPGVLQKELLPKDITIKGKRLIGVHTYSISSNFEVIDVQYLVFNRNKWRKK